MSELARVIRAVATAVEQAADELNRLDGVAGDGDLGVTMQSAAAVTLGVTDDLADASPAELLQACGLAIARGAPSTAGTLVATGLLRAARALPTIGPATPATTFATLLEAAGTGIAERGRAEVGSKTMLDALVPAALAAAAAAKRGSEIDQTLAEAASAAEAGAEATAAMHAVHGRAGWLAERSAGHEDAGARLVAIGLRAAADARDGS